MKDRRRLSVSSFYLQLLYRTCRQYLQQICSNATTVCRFCIKLLFKRRQRNRPLSPYSRILSAILLRDTPLFMACFPMKRWASSSVIRFFSTR